MQDLRVHKNRVTGQNSEGCDGNKAIQESDGQENSKSIDYPDGRKESPAVQESEEHQTSQISQENENSSAVQDHEREQNDTALDDSNISLNIPPVREPEGHQSSTAFLAIEEQEAVQEPRTIVRKIYEQETYFAVHEGEVRKSGASQESFSEMTTLIQEPLDTKESETLSGTVQRSEIHKMPDEENEEESSTSNSAQREENVGVSQILISQPVEELGLPSARDLPSEKDPAQEGQRERNQPTQPKQKPLDLKQAVMSNFFSLISRPRTLGQVKRPSSVPPARPSMGRNPQSLTITQIGSGQPSLSSDVDDPPTKDPDTPDDLAVNSAGIGLPSVHEDIKGPQFQTHTVVTPVISGPIVPPSPGNLTDTILLDMTGALSITSNPRDNSMLSTNFADSFDPIPAVLEMANQFVAEDASTKMAVNVAIFTDVSVTPIMEAVIANTPATNQNVMESSTDSPLADTPATETSTSDTPATGNPSADTPDTDNSTADTPATNTTTADNPATGNPSADTPDTDNPTTDTPATNTTTADNPATGNPSADTPATGNPSADTPATDNPTADTQATDTPTADTPATRNPSADTPATDTTTADTPATGNHSADTPDNDTPTADTPATGNLSEDTPATDTPAIDAQNAGSPANDTPTTDTFATGNPSACTPATETPTSDTPVTGNPSADIPDTDNPTADTPATDSPTADNPAKCTSTGDSPTTDIHKADTAVLLPLASSAVDPPFLDTTIIETMGNYKLDTLVTKSSFTDLTFDDQALKESSSKSSNSAGELTYSTTLDSAVTHSDFKDLIHSATVSKTSGQDLCIL
jgi:hypothetical protein